MSGDPQRVTIVSSLLCSRHVEMAITCLGSLTRHCRDAIAIRIHDDGSLTDADADKLCESLPATVLRRAEADEKLHEVLRNKPAAARYRASHPMALKLLDTVFADESEEVFTYCDSDILFFRPFRGLGPLSDGVNAVFAADAQNSYTVSALDLLREPRFRLPLRCNAGFMRFRKALFDLDYVEWFVSHPLPVVSHWTEQTCWALRGQAVGCRVWDHRQVRIMRPSTRLDSDLVAGHFTSKVRSMLDDFAQHADDCADDSPVALRTVAGRRCRFPNLAWPRIVDRFKRLMPGRSTE